MFPCQYVFPLTYLLAKRQALQLDLDKVPLSYVLVSPGLVVFKDIRLLETNGKNLFIIQMRLV